MAATFKALSALLSYPGEDLQAGTAEIEAIIRAEGLVDPDVCAQLEALLTELAQGDVFALQERYVELFDRTRKLSLHLFEHVHGESRDRGQAMVDLAALYERGGLALATQELPDYLPLFLEFLSTQPLEDARSLLAEAAHIAAALEERLAQRGSRYAAVFSAIRCLAGVQPEASVDVVEAGSPAHDDLAALDREWAETAVTFGPGEPGDGCSVDRLRIQMRAARRDARQLTA
ncbi:MAG: nitrate reductase molybdenum cofactor assembly chaperone [Pseudomonadota bacterium]